MKKRKVKKKKKKEKAKRKRKKKENPKKEKNRAWPFLCPKGKDEKKTLGNQVKKRQCGEDNRPRRRLSVGCYDSRKMCDGNGAPSYEGGLASAKWKLEFLLTD